VPSDCSANLASLRGVEVDVLGVPAVVRDAVARIDLVARTRVCARVLSVSTGAD
jgi:hypothetical protein